MEPTRPHRVPRRGRPVAAGIAALLLFLLLLAPRAAQAQRGVAAPIYQPNFDSLIEGAEDWLAGLERQGWLLRGQFTTVLQGNAGFRSPYRGPGSFNPVANFRNTQSIDLVVGRRLWSNAEIIAVPTVTRGFGLSNSVGIAAYPNGEAFRLGTTDPLVWLSRLFVRQTIDLSGDTEGQDPDPMRFAGPLARERITITAGRVSAWDFFDDNRYAHDARSQFLNWALVGTGAFDFAADARGFTNGLVLEWEDGSWAVRAGAFMVARDANSLELDNRPAQGRQLLLQLERGWQLAGRGGIARLLLGDSRTRSARWDALAAALPTGTDDAALRRYRSKRMLALNLEQALTESLGGFLRLGWNDGRTQNWMFTEMDWSLSAGLSLTGRDWDRPQDTVGLGFNLGGLSAPHRRFLQAGGIGFITGDGRLRYRPETALEAYYSLRLAPGLHATLDAQLVFNPGYNADRGPVPLLALRLQAAF